MKKWMYLVFPGIMLAGFLAVYFSHKQAADEREHVRAARVAQKLAEDKAQKDKAEALARESAQKAQKEREMEDAKKEADRRAKQAAIDKQIKDDTAAANADADKSAKLAAEKEIELDALHKQRDQTNREAFDLVKQVELAKVAQRTAELETQRMVEMISRRAAESSMVRMPPPPPPPPK